MPENHVLFIEDEQALRMTLSDRLAAEGYAVECSEDGLDGLKRATESAFDLILLDVMLPNKDGFEVCRDLRRGGLTTPVIMLTAKAQEAEKVLGLDVGADDYVTKPFSPRELVLRVQAILRRGGAAAVPEEVRSYGSGALVIDEPRRLARVGGAAVELTPTEWGILVALATVPGRVYSRFELINRVRGY